MVLMRFRGDIASEFYSRDISREQEIMRQNPLLSDARELDRHYIPSRHPNAHPSGTAHEAYDQKTSENAIKASEKIIEFASKSLGENG